MRIPDSPTRILRGTRFCLPLALLLAATGCEERARLVNEIAVARKEIAELQPQFSAAQIELNQLNKTYQSLRMHPVIRKTGAENLAKEVEVLEERKKNLEAEVAGLRTELELYRKENP